MNSNYEFIEDKEKNDEMRLNMVIHMVQRQILHLISMVHGKK
ncbi:hypothetical protein QEP67_12605 [Bacillus cereus group sp. MS39]|uniref:Uncharacterized protein n=1 Tax=Bacillus cereus group sp. MS39 TaxID=3041344 RepID=A0AAU8FC65_9BACI